MLNKNQQVTPYLWDLLKDLHELFRKKLFRGHGDGKFRHNS